MTTLRERYRTAFVTGASSGLGAAFARMLLREGVRVWGASRSHAAVADAAGFVPAVLDLTDPASIDAAWQQADADSGGIDLLVNCAGAGLFGPFESTPTEAWERQIDVLLVGPARLARLALVAMGARRRGCIVNVSSLAVDFPIPFMSAYNAGKAGLSALSATLDLEAAGAGVSVIDFRPGDYRTSFNRSMERVMSGGADRAACVRVWQRLESLLAAAPDPERAAADLRRALLRGRRGVVCSGSWFQAVLAARFGRLLPSSWLARLHRHYHGLD